MSEKRTNGEVTCDKEETSHLKCWTKFGGENEGKGKRKKERKERRRGEERREVRSFDFFL